SQQYLHWVPRNGVFAATCLDASEWIAECLKLFGSSIMMSATLSPFNSYRESCGLDKESVTIAQAQTPWRDDAYDVAIDCRIDTRLIKRESHYKTTALTIVELIQHNAGGAIAVFFASYLYAENIQAYIEALAPELRIKRQPRGVDLVEQSIFINEGLLIADALFLILGSSYAEGIDQLGGRVEQIMIVGPALPEVNLLQKKKMEDHPSLSQDEAFRDIYIRPAMRRIHQALGRIVRAPGHTARVLLHCKRFAEDAYQSELAPEYQSDCQLLRDEDFFRWLNSSKSSSQIM
ncbi:MAG: helicase C-terminal domain-containing protein, partial [Verrucomicrobiota bacterium]|nr:helicase C-terminal domain-containing protein [Verrucomicrobiota bacterium]